MKLCISTLLFLATLTIEAQVFFEDQANIVGITEDTGVVSMGGGVSFVDYDDDGWDDITLGTGNGKSIQFYKNYDGFFAQESLLPVDLNFQNKSINWVDFDNDGDKDLFVTSQTDGNRLYERLSDNTLVDITVSAGFVTENLFTFGTSWGDINNDGCLDIYISNYTDTSTITNYFYQSNCDGTFTEVTNQVGLSNTPALTFCSGFFDFNNDGWQDIYIANDKIHQNYLYKNNGDGTFTDVSQASGTDVIVDAMSVTVDDFNSDGYLDIFITNTPNDVAVTFGSTILLKNNGDETFSNISESANAQLDSWSWGANFFDAENDGDLDLYVSCSYDGSNGFPSYGFYENSGFETFENSIVAGFDNNGSSFSSAIGDTNNDGLVDLIVNNNNQTPFIWNNETTTDHNYIKVKLIGMVSNRDAIGSKIEVSVDGELQYRYLMCGEGYLGQNSLVEHIGIDDATTIDYIKVTWLSGVEDILYNVAPNQTITVTEGSTLSVKDFDEDITLKYQNPIDNELIMTSSHSIENMVIYNNLGISVFEASFKNKHCQINTNNLSEGIYFCRIRFDSSASKTVKIAKK
ncbi:MAG: FG-GAP-like repeat-containing protein [Winogradskyella sp.]|uniref:FG-GAP-like repeat-containing protein n=1 Tax=Winogradskyella sp. TaxID=1883156 RepID=UPI00385EF516